MPMRPGTGSWMPDAHSRFRTGGSPPLAALLWIALLAGCTDSKEVGPPAAPADTTPPGPISDLRTAEVADRSALLVWSAPADEGAEGSAASFYDVRFRAESLDEGVWDLATRAAGAPIPGPPGSGEEFLLGDLEPETPYAAGIKSGDEAGNLSSLSNVVRFETTATPADRDTIPPAAVEDLRAGEVGSDFVRLHWTATGDDGREGTAAAYDLRFRLGGLDSTTWEEATPVAGPPPPRRSGLEESFTVTGLSPLTPYGFGLRVRDDAGNESDLSPVVEVTTGIGVPEFSDPRGVAASRTQREVYVADFGDGAVYRTGMLGTTSKLFDLPGVVDVARSTATNRFYALTASQETGESALWSFTGSVAEPTLLAEGFATSVDLEIDANGNLLVAAVSPGAILRFGPLGSGPEVLVDLAGAVVAGVAVASDARVFFGYSREGAAEIGVRMPDGSIAGYHAPAAPIELGDLTIGPDGLDPWFLDRAGDRVLRVPEGGATAEVVAEDLIEPVSIATQRSGETAVLFYSSRLGFVLRQELPVAGPGPRGSR